MWISFNNSQLATLRKLLPRIKRPGRHRNCLRSLIKTLANAESDAKNPTLQKYVDAAKEQHYREGECEIDDDAVVSPGDDPGAYVMAWVWVYDRDAGVKEEDEDEEEEDKG